MNQIDWRIELALCLLLFSMAPPLGYLIAVLTQMLVGEQPVLYWLFDFPTPPKDIGL